MTGSLHASPSARRPKASVCVITYNHERYIAQCLQSLVDQKTGFDVEIVVADDCSKDGTRAILHDFAARHPDLVRIVLRPHNIGGTDNYLDVHAAATGDYVAHCDGDDHWEPGKLDAQIRFLDAHPGCAAVFTNSHVISEQGQRLGLFSCGVPESFDVGYLIRDGNFLHHSSMMYRRALQSRMFPPTKEFIDFEVYVLLGRHGRLGYIDQCLTSYRSQSSASIIHNDNRWIRRLGWQALARVTPADAPEASIRRADASFLADAAYQALRSRRPGRYREWLALVRQRPGSALLRIQLAALVIMLASIARKALFHARVRLGLARPQSRVFYPK